jgi:glycosyltransferase involved in cell wall biosynthesis
MRICITHFAFCPTTGGVESHLLELCSEFVREGHAVFALVGSRPDSPDYENINGIEVHRRNWLNIETLRERKKNGGYAPPVAWPHLQDEIRENFRAFIDEHRIDVVHAHNFHHFLPEYGMALSQLHEEGLPTVMTIHEVWNEFLCEDLLQRTTWDSILTVSKHVATGIRIQAPHLDNLRVLYMGIDTDRFSPETGAKDAARWNRELGIGKRPMILHPARMLPWKGVVYSVRALDIIRREFPDVLLIVTDTPDIVDWADELKGCKEEVRAEIEQRKLDKNVLCRSFAYTDLPAIYANAAVVIYPTIGEEPFGLVPVEAMSCGRPAIVARSGGLVESVVDGETGYIVERRDEKRLAGKCLELLHDRVLAEKLGEAGRKHVLECFRRERMAAETLELYEQALCRRVLV